MAVAAAPVALAAAEAHGGAALEDIEQPVPSDEHARVVPTARDVMGVTMSGAPGRVS